MSGTTTDRPDDLAGDDRDFVALIVRDTGSGMTDEVQRRAFEPFFSTKEVGQGTGLGLSMVYGLTKQLGGTVRLDSHVGQGTTISLFLPRAEARLARPVYTASSALEVRAQPKIDRVLLVDDDQAVRGTVAAMLRELGDQVVEAEDADKALAILDRGEPVDIMIADMVMPGLHGPALASEARRRRPGLPVLLITGHPTDAAETVAAERVYPVLRKPFRQDELNAMVQSCQRTPRSTNGTDVRR
jgi:CheY-like chemotaxis protein